VNDLPMSVDTRLEEEAGRAMNYRVLGHQVEFLGLCPLCDSSDISIKNNSQEAAPGPGLPSGGVRAAPARRIHDS
jgi:hypothetical protein